MNSVGPLRILLCVYEYCPYCVHASVGRFFNLNFYQSSFLFCLFLVIFNCSEIFNVCVCNVHAGSPNLSCLSEKTSHSIHTPGSQKDFPGRFTASETFNSTFNSTHVSFVFTVHSIIHLKKVHENQTSGCLGQNLMWYPWAAPFPLRCRLSMEMM